ncbi:MAG TPA: 2-oxoacid:acceptor oxidoreductase family protein [Patescibacteria group bacterium]|nr:2-oxoacid:acceptor oxidoreductase family protein [Patescibacteria group bacterium]
MPTKIVLAGEGGLGVQTIAKIIGLAAIKSGRQTSYLPSFGVEQRGGVSIAFVQISSKPIPYPRFSKADIVIAFSNRAIDALKEFIKSGALFIYDSSVIDNLHLEKIKSQVKEYIAIPAQSTARDALTLRVSNVILLGAIATHLKDINFEGFENALNEEFAEKIAKKPEIKDLNLKALKLGLEMAQKFDKTKQPLVGAEDPKTVTNFENAKVAWKRFPEYCKGCALCIVSCPVKCLSFGNETNFLGTYLPQIEIEKCIVCLKCMKICPEAAIQVEKREGAAE